MSSHEFIDVSTFLKCSDTEIPKFSTNKSTISNF